jgi:hypothetical protein
MIFKNRTCKITTERSTFLFIALMKFCVWDMYEYSKVTRQIMTELTISIP